MGTKYIFVTGGVVSSVGKGITTAAIGRLLKSRGFSVVIQKLDPYLNVDPGTMSPYQHGEVFVTADGAETDLDLGHYERFLDQDLTGLSSVTAGQIYQAVIARERRGAMSSRGTSMMALGIPLLCRADGGRGQGGGYCSNVSLPFHIVPLTPAGRGAYHGRGREPPTRGL